MNSAPNSSNGLPRNERLRGKRSVSELFGEGHSGFVFPIRYMWIEGAAEGTELPNAEVLFTVPKRFHKRANRRNLLRRRVKEAYRLQRAELGGGLSSLHIALVYSTKEILEYDRISRAVAKIMTQIREERGQL